MRIQTPASDSRHSASAAPGIRSMCRSMWRSRTAWRCSSSNSSAVRIPHSLHPQETSRVSDSTGTPNLSAAIRRNVPM